MAVEFEKGQRVVEMREFFSPETAAAGDAAYQRFSFRFKDAVVSVITVAVILVFVTVYFLVKKIRNSRDASQ